MAVGIVDQLLGQLDKANADYVTKGYQALVSGCGPMMNTIIIIYIAWIGWKTINHWEGFSAGNFVKQVLKVSVIYSIATDWTFFSTYLYNVLTNGPNELSKILMGAVGSHYDSTNSALNELFVQGLQTGRDLWNKSGFWSGLLGCVLAIDVWILTIAVTAVAIIMIGVAKAFLAILIVMAPIFVYFLLSDSFKAITESWFKLTLGFALVPLFVNSALLYTNDMLKKSMDTIVKSIEGKEILDAITAIAVYDIGIFLCAVLLWKAADLAAHIGGGIAVSGLDQISSLASGSAIGEMMKANIQSLRKSKTPRDTKPDGGGTGRWESKDNTPGKIKDKIDKTTSRPNGSGGGGSNNSGGTFDGSSGSDGKFTNGQSRTGSVIGGAGSEGSIGGSGSSGSDSSVLGNDAGNAVASESAKKKAIRKRSYDRRQKIGRARLLKNQRAQH